MPLLKMPLKNKKKAPKIFPPSKTKNPPKKYKNPPKT